MQNRLILICFLFCLNLYAETKFTPGFTVAPTVTQKTAPSKQEENDIDELQKNSIQTKEAYKAINTINPVSTDFGKKSPSLASSQTDSANELLQSKWAQVVLTLASNENFKSAVLEMKANPKTSLLLQYQLVFLALFFILKFFLNKKTKTGFKRFSLWVVTTLVFWVGTLFVVPFVVWGNPYIKAIDAAIKTAWTTFH